MTRRRRLGLALLALLGALVAAEIGARLFVLPDRKIVWRPLPPFTGLQTAEQRAWLERQERELGGDELLGYGVFDPLLGWTLRPSSRSPDGAVHVDARGLRGTREYADEIPPGVVRILSCGDSFTFCAEVRDAETWQARIEARRADWEVWNYGVGGYGTDQALLRLRELAAGPVDALLVGLLLENIGRNVNRYRPLWYSQSDPAAKPRYRLAPSGLELVPQPFATRAEFVQAVRTGAVLELMAEHEHWRDPCVPAGLGWSALARLFGAKRAYAARDIEVLWADEEGEPFRTTLAILEESRSVARQLGTERLLVLVFPTEADLRGLVERGNRFWTPLLRALDQRGIACLDLADTLAGAGPAGIEALYLESHLGPRGNELVAEAVAARLAQWFPEKR